ACGWLCSDDVQSLHTCPQATAVASIPPAPPPLPAAPATWPAPGMAGREAGRACQLDAAQPCASLLRNNRNAGHGRHGAEGRSLWSPNFAPSLPPDCLGANSEDAWTFSPRCNRTSGLRIENLLTSYALKLPMELRKAAAYRRFGLRTLGRTTIQAMEHTDITRRENHEQHDWKANKSVGGAGGGAFGLFGRALASANAGCRAT